MDYTQYKHLEFRRKFFKLLGAEINITDPETGKEVGFIQMKAWKLREDIRLYSDSSKSRELLRIRARSVIDFGVTYDIFDGDSETLLFSLRRAGLKSTFIRDKWVVTDGDGAEIGAVEETSSGLALMRRYVDLVPFVGWAIDLALDFKPITYSIQDTAGANAGDVVQRKNPFIVKFGLDTSNATASLDPRLPVAAVALMSVIDAGKD